MLMVKRRGSEPKFFKKMASSNRRKSSNDRLMVREEITEDKVVIKKEILDYYQNLYIEFELWRPTADFEDLASLNEEEKDWLESPFEEQVVLAALNSCAPDKAAGPDGYTMAFFQKAWNFFKLEVLNALSYFHQNCHMVKSCNASFIALIPKKKGATELRDYTPVSLIGSVL